jgi:predicted AAA+ superfamily ATPase
VSFQRLLVLELTRGLAQMPRLVHVVTGPRQVGKTTAALSVAKRWKGPVRFAAADELLPPGPEWIRDQIDRARADMGKEPVLLVLDEVQKIAGWSEVVKAEWDRVLRLEEPLRLILLGSSALLLGRGVTESLAGRFFLHRCPHWTFGECKKAFGWTFDQWIFFGGYPGAAPFAADLDTWRAYVRDSLIEAVLARDVLSLDRVTKPTLLRHLFALSCRFPAQPLSYNKMLGQLQDAGNTTTLAHYLELLARAFLVSGLEKYSAGKGRSRGSTPKLVPWNNALVSALDLRTFAAARADGAHWGRLVENAVGAHLLNHLQDAAFDVSWWREGAEEVDFVIRGGDGVWALEVKSGRPAKLRGLEAFCRRHRKARPIIVGSGGTGLEEFFLTDPRAFLAAR